MRTTIDPAGRIVVPKALRDRLVLTGGTEVEVEERDGVLEIRAVPADVSVVETPDGPVAEPNGAIPALTDAVVQATLDRVRR